MIPPAKRGGRGREVVVRQILNGIMYVLSTACQWRYTPKDLPPRSTLHDYFQRWGHDGTLTSIHYALYVKCREQTNRSASPTAGIIDSQSVKSAEKGGRRVDPHGYDAGKKIKGKKRHIVVDAEGLLVHAVVHTADIQDRDGGVLALSSMPDHCAHLKVLFADGGYQGPKFRTAAAEILPQLAVQIVKRSDQGKGFVVLPRRWVVERSIAWLNRCRRLAKDFENLTRNALAFVMLASIRLMLRKLCNSA